MISSILQNLTVYNCPFRKRRCGRNHDGGYITVDLPVEYTLLLSGGIGDDISFEMDFLRRNPKVIACEAFDGTIKHLPNTHLDDPVNRGRIHFHKQNIGPISSGTSMSDLKQFLTQDTTSSPLPVPSVFLKMDIKGAEIPWLEALLPEHLNALAQIVIEFHGLFSERENAVFDKINRTHVLVHFHGNNCGGTRQVDYCNTLLTIPNVFECTYVHRCFFKSSERRGEASLGQENNYLIQKNTTDRFPGPLDQSNSPGHPDIPLSFPPFYFERERVFVLEVQSYERGKMNEHVGYMNKIFSSKQAATDYYDKYNPGMRSLNAHGNWRSDCDPTSHLLYVVREFGGESLKVPAFEFQ